LHVHEFVPGPVSAQAAWASHPPLFVAQASTGVHVMPLPEYPVLQAQLTVFGPVEVQCAVVAHPPLFVAHPLIPVHVWPLPV
jgi:hypothetical protein